MAELITQLRFMTGDATLSDETGKFFLEMCEGDVKKAAEFYKEQMPAAAPRPPPLAAAASSGARTTSIGISSHHSRASTTAGAGSLGTSRRRTSAAIRLPANLEPTVRHPEPGGVYEPGAGLVTTRANRGFANNVDLLGNAAEFEFLGGTVGHSSFNSAPPVRTINYPTAAPANNYGFSSPGAFNTYQDGEEGFIAIERRESADRRSSAMNPPTQAMGHYPPRRTRTDGDIPSRSQSNSINNHSTGSASTPRESGSAGQLKKPPPASPKEDNDTAGLKKPPPAPSRPEEKKMGDSWTGKHIGKNPHNSATLSELGDSGGTLMASFAEAEDNGTGMGNSSRNSISSSQRRRISDMDYSVEPMAKPLTKSVNGHSDEDQMAIMQAMQGGMMEDTSITNHFYEDGESTVPRLSGTTCSTSLSSSFGSGAKRDSAPHRASHLMAPAEPTIPEEASVSTAVASASASAASPVAEVVKRKPDPPGETIDTPWLLESTGRTPPGSPKKEVDEEDDDDEGAKKPAAKPTPQSTSASQKDAKVRRAPATLPGAVSVGILSSDEPGPKVNEPQNGKVRRAPATLPGAVSVGVVAGEPIQRDTSNNEHHREPSQSPAIVPRRHVNDGNNQSSSSSLPLVPIMAHTSKGQHGKTRRVPATIPGAVNVSGREEPSNHDSQSSNPISLGDSHNSASSFPSAEPDSKIRRAPATRPGAVKVINKNEEPTTKAKDHVSRHITHPGENGAAEQASNISPKQRDGKGKRHSRATAPGAVFVSAEEPGMDASNDQQQQQQQQQNQQSPIPAPSGKVRHRHATQPGAVGVSGAENDRSHTKEGKLTPGLRKSSKPGAVNVTGDDETQQESEKQKAGLRRSNGAPGAVSVRGTTEQDTAEQSKTSRFRLGPKPEVVVQVTNPSSSSPDDPKSDAKKADKKDKKVQGTWKTKKPGAVSVTSSENEDDNGTGTLGADFPAMDPEDFAATDDPNADLDIEGEGEIHLATLTRPRERIAETEPILPFPTRPEKAHVRPQRNTRHNSPGRVISDPTRGFLDHAPLPLAPPKNRRNSDSMQPASKKDKKGGIFGIFKKKGKDKKLMTDMDVGFHEDDVILARTGASRGALTREPAR